MNSLLATRMRERRLELNLSQTELAQGLCEQAKISRIEQGKYVPNSDLLHSLSQRLDVKLDYFYDKTTTAEISQITQLKVILEKYIALQDFASVKYILDLELSTQKSIKYSIADKIYLTWIESLVLFYHDNKQKEGLKKLRKIISQIGSQIDSHLYLKNTLLNFLLEEKGSNFIELEQVFLEIVAELRRSDLSKIENLKNLIKIRYNYCRQLWLLGNRTEQAIIETLETIEVCNDYQSRFLLAELYCLLGNISEGFHEKEQVKAYYQRSQFLFQLANNEKMSLELSRYLYENFSA
ncbi:helix-turn-helix domain-containing protein [Streptococcus caprae]|uniref:Helix-turn-helix domain-containing protein n=1 Tax=Streptococcus caprae TaxID=1640501 RepID=A0ABV8CY35_9STRE